MVGQTIVKRIFHWSFLVGALCFGAGFYPQSFGAEPGTTVFEDSVPSEEIFDDGASSDPIGDDLDKLLDIAEKDLGQMSQVAVRPPAAGNLNTAVTTVNRTPSTVGKTPAAVYVIDNEMIRRSGAQSIP